METLATLAMDIDVRSADPAEAKLKGLTAAARELEAQAGRTSAAAKGLGVGYAASAGAAGKAAEAHSKYTGALSEEATLLLRNAQFQDRWAKEVERSAGAAGKAAEALEKRVGRLTASYDPLSGVIDKTNKDLAEAKALFDAGALSAEKYGHAQSALTGRLKSLQEAHTGAAGAAKLQSYQLLNLGRQGADVAVSLASGQALWLVAIQQGAQIGEVFAEAKTQGLSFKSALSDLAGGAMRLLFSPGGLFAVGAIAVGGLTLAFMKGAKEQAEFRNELTITGNIAGLTAGKFEDMAHRIADANNTSFADTKTLISQAAASGKLSGDTLSLAVQNAQAFSKFTGESASKYLAEYEKMKGGVAKFGAEHALVYHDITLQQLKQIEVLEKAGKAREAELLLMKDIHSEIKERGEPAYGYLEKITITITNRAKDMWDAILGVGREKTLEQKLADAQSGLKQLTAPGTRTQDTLKQDKDGNYYYGAAEAAATQSAISTAKLRVGLLSMLVTGQNQAAAKDAKQGQDEADKISKWLDDRNKSTARDMTDERTAELDKALATAKAAELQVQLGLTKDLEGRAKIEKDIAKAEWEVREAEINKTLAGIHDDKGLSAAKKAELAAGWVAVATAEKHVVDLKTQGVDLQLFSDQIARRRAVEDTIAGYTDRQAQAQVALATSLEQAQAIENKATADRQAREQDRRDFDLFMDYAGGLKTAAEIRQIQNGVAAADAGDKQVKATLDRVAIIERDTAVAQAGRQNEIDLLNSKSALTYSVREQAATAERIRDLQYDIAVADQKTIIAKVREGNGTAKDAELAERRIAVLTEIHDNDEKIAARQNDMLNAYTDAVEAISGMARSIVDGDVGGAITGFSNTLAKLAASTSGAISSALGGAAAVAGPIGVAISATASVFAAIGQASAAKAQKKLDDLNQSVRDLKTANTTSSGSIAGTLEQANKNWNADLEYSSAMVTSLRSIDSHIGALANAVSKSISAGNLLDTSGLGLGSVGSKGQLSFLGLLGGLSSKKSTTDLLDQGLNFNPTTYGALGSGGLSGSTYADLVTTTVKKFLGVSYGTKVSTNTVTGALDGGLTSQISAIVQELGKGVLSAAAVFGSEAAKAAEGALGSAVVDLGKLSLKDLKPDEIASVLQATFDKVGDQLAAAGVPGLDALATVGEGSFETLTRLAREYQVVDASLASLGKAFGQTGIASLAARDALVQAVGGIDALVSQTSFFATNFLTSAEQMAPVIKAVNDNLAQFGLSAESSRDQFKALVLAQDLTTEAGRNTYAALLAIAPAFDKVASAADASAKTISDAAAQMVSDADSRVSAARSALQASYDAEKSRLQGIVDAATSAEAALRTAYDAQSSSIQSTIDKLTSFSQSVKDFGRTLVTGDLSGASTAQRYAATKAEFDRVRQLAMAGDETAQGQYQGAAQDFLKASADNSSTALGYLADLGAVKDATDQLGKTADDQASLAQQQLTQLKTQVGALVDLGGDVKSVETAITDLLTARGAAAIAADQLKALDQQVAGLLEINTSVLSVVDAINGLHAAIQALADAKAVQASGAGWTSPTGGVAVPTNPGYTNPYGNNGAVLGVEGLLGKNAAGQVTFDGFTPAELAWANSPLELGGEKTSAAQAIIELKKMYGPNVLPGFAKGGIFTNGIVSQPTAFNMGQMGEAGPEAIVPLVSGPGGLGVRMHGANDDSTRGLVAEVRALRQEVAMLRQDRRAADLPTIKSLKRLVEIEEEREDLGTLVRGEDGGLLVREA